MSTPGKYHETKSMEHDTHLTPNRYVISELSHMIFHIRRHPPISSSDMYQKRYAVRNYGFYTFYLCIFYTSSYIIHLKFILAPSQINYKSLDMGAWLSLAFSTHRISKDIYFVCLTSIAQVYFLYLSKTSPTCCLYMKTMMILKIVFTALCLSAIKCYTIYVQLHLSRPVITIYCQNVQNYFPLYLNFHKTYKMARYA